MTENNGINPIERDDPRFTAIADATTFSGFTALAEPDPDRPSNRRIVAMALITLFLAAFLAQLAFFGSLLLTKEYRARADVQYRGSAWTETQNVAVQSRSLTAPVAAEFGIDIKEFEEQLDAGLVPGTQILRIDYIDSDRDLARNIVAMLSQNYIRSIEELPSLEAEALLQTELDGVLAEIQVAQDGLTDLAAQLDELAEEKAQEKIDREEAKFNDDPTDDVSEPAVQVVTVDDEGGTIEVLSNKIRAEQQAFQQLLSSLRVRKNDLEFRLLDTELRKFEKLENGSPEIITEPFVFEDAVFPRPPIFALVGFVLGAAIGGLIMMYNWNRTAWSSIDALTRRLPGGASEPADLDLDEIDLDRLEAERSMAQTSVGQSRSDSMTTSNRN